MTKFLFKFFVSSTLSLDCKFGKRKKKRLKVVLFCCGCVVLIVFFLLLGFLDRSVLIEGVLFRARYLGSTQLVCEGQPTKTTRMMQAEEAVSRIKVKHGPVHHYLCMHSLTLFVFVSFLRSVRYSLF